jgi:hypothetical protein
MRTIWQWRNHGETVWKGLSTEKPRQFWIQKEYREIEIGEPRFHYETGEGGGEWPHRFGLIGVSPRDSMWRLMAEPATKWCGEYGHHDWMQLSAAFYFKDSPIALAFRLRWC